MIILAAMKPRYLRELRFWIIFLGINFLLFVPTYLAQWGAAEFFPWSVFKGASIVGIGKGLLYNRENLDFFRLSIEFSLSLIAIILLSPPRHRRRWGYTAFAFYLLLLIYQIYHQAFLSLYQTPPFFYNDWGLLQVGLKIFLQEWQYVHLLGIALGLLFLSGIAWTIRWLVRQHDRSSFSYASYAIFLFLLAESLVFGFRWGYKAWPEHVLQFQVAPIIVNARESIEAQQQMSRLDMEALAEHRPYEEYKLAKQPNFYFLFVESYGRLLYDDPQLTEGYQAVLAGLEKKLADSTWYTASILSTAPVTGGASWVSYASFMDGFNYRNRGTYWALLEDTTYHRYQHLLRWLQGQDYRNYRLSAIGGTEDVQIPWDTYGKFYAVDEWIRYSDFNYQGLLYGWGPSPPDQFSLNYAREYIQNEGTGPHTLFFITQNSHNPFVSPTEVAPNWRLLNDSTVNQATESRFFEPPVIENYGKSINYQLQYLIDFIVKEGREEDIFILVGDHQPPLFPLTEIGFETPLHVISKNKAFVEAFHQQGLSPGLWVADTDTKLRHEGFYSLLLHHLWPLYGDSSRVAPKYLPQGLDIFSLPNPPSEKKY